MRIAALFLVVLAMAVSIPVGVLLLREGEQAAVTGTPAAVPGQQGISGAAAVRNAEMATSLSATGTVQLIDGAGNAPAASGDGELAFRLSDLFVFGDLDGDGRDETAVILVVTRLGRPFAVQVGVIGSRTSATGSLPAGSLVRSVQIDQRELAVRYRDGESGLERERRYQFGARGLVLLGETDVPPGAAESAFAYAIERVVVPAGGQALLERRLPPGLGADFLLTLNQGQGFSLWAESEFSNAILSVFGTRDQRTVVSRRDYISQYTGVSPIAQDYVVRVINVSGGELPFRLSITAPGGTPPGSGPVVGGFSGVEPPPGGFRAPQGQFPLAALSPIAAREVESGAGRVAAAVVRLSDGALFTAGSPENLELVSTVKLLILAAQMSIAEQERRELTPRELDLLWPMIAFSDNDSATLLWQSLGSEAGMQAWLESARVAGFQPAPLDEWGATTSSAAALAVMLARLYSGDLISPEHRDLALEMMDAIIEGQRWGVSAGAAESGASYVLKNGWFPEPDGWQVVSAGIVVRAGPSRAYAIAVMTDRQDSWEAGIATIEAVASAVATAVAN